MELCQPGGRVVQNDDDDDDDAGIVSLLWVEFWAIYKGMQLTKDCGFMCIEVKSDLSSVVSLISNDCGL
ncbi:hypothetical protein L195_g009378 [Trifolium pratense]|uniref:RNase H type-1 domain-containing protein n=1 Tax=Trifolium pratense TaxID=57577 RepID=A0A2K3PBS8_TRIPR|nr:hypothetical protein L195_g009378 [Trifolium pratense]